MLGCRYVKSKQEIIKTTLPFSYKITKKKKSLEKHYCTDISKHPQDRVSVTSHSEIEVQ